MQKKVGPLPVWGWAAAIAVGVAIYIIRRRNAANAAGTAQAGPALLDPNTVDPNTGLTYGQELNTPSLGGAGGGGITGGGGSIPGVVDSIAPPPTVSTDSTAPAAVDLSGGFLSGLAGWAQITGALETLGVRVDPRPASGAAPKSPKGRSGHGTGHPGKKPPAHHAPRVKPPAVHRGDRAPAHPHEPSHASVPGHHAPPPPHTRFKVKPKRR